MYVGGGIADSRSAVLRATVFDLDDTLIESGGAWVSTCAVYAAAHDHQWTAADSAAMHGNGDWSSYVAGLCGGPPPAQVADDCAQGMINAMTDGDIRLLPGAAGLVDEAGRFGPVALVSAAPRRFVDAAVAHFGLADCLLAVVCGEDVARQKPAPDPYLRAAAELGTAPGDCVAVEDSADGIRSAHAAGLTVLAIPRPGDPLADPIGRLAACQAGNATEAAPLLRRLHGPRPGRG
ncbi:MAG TPA: HAD family phosphatase [Trebonia sp.]